MVAPTSTPFYYWMGILSVFKTFPPHMTLTLDDGTRLWPPGYYNQSENATTFNGSYYVEQIRNDPDKSGPVYGPFDLTDDLWNERVKASTGKYFASRSRVEIVVAFEDALRHSTVDQTEAMSFIMQRVKMLDCLIA